MSDIIEAAARAIYEYDMARNSAFASSMSWKKMRALFPDYNDDQGRALLAAVTPLIRAAALEEAARVAEDCDVSKCDAYMARCEIADRIRALKEQP